MPLPQFEYQPFVNPYAANIADEISRSADARAHAAATVAQAQAHASEVSSGAWAGATQNIASTAAQQIDPDPRTQAEKLSLETQRRAQGFTKAVNDTVAQLTTA